MSTAHIVKCKRNCEVSDQNLTRIAKFLDRMLNSVHFACSYVLLCLNRFASCPPFVLLFRLIKQLPPCMGVHPLHTLSLVLFLSSSLVRYRQYSRLRSSLLSFLPSVAVTHIYKRKTLKFESSCKTVVQSSKLLIRIRLELNILIAQ